MNSDIKFGKDITIDEKTKIGIYSDIGNGAVIGSGAVVTHDVEPYSVKV